ncbi:unnamed protein product, partial [Bubo scandiacus]
YPEQDADEFTFPMGAKKTWGRLELAFFIIGGCHKMWTTFGAPGGLQLSLKETEYDDPNTMVAGTRTRNPYNSGVCKTAPGGTADRVLTGLSAPHTNWKHLCSVLSLGWA